MISHPMSVSINFFVILYKFHSIILWFIHGHYEYLSNNRKDYLHHANLWHVLGACGTWTASDTSPDQLNPDNIVFMSSALNRSYYTCQLKLIKMMCLMQYIFWGSNLLPNMLSHFIIRTHLVFITITLSRRQPRRQSWKT